MPIQQRWPEDKSATADWALLALMSVRSRPDCDVPKQSRDRRLTPHRSLHPLHPRFSLPPTLQPFGRRVRPSQKRSLVQRRVLNPKRPKMGRILTGGFQALGSGWPPFLANGAIWL